MRLVGDHVAPYEPGTDCSVCYTYATDAARNRVWGGDGDVKPIHRPVVSLAPVSIPLPMLAPCEHEGAIVSACLTCQAERNHERQCLHPDGLRDKCTRGNEQSTLQRCNVCPGYSSPSPPTIPVGVVIGSYRWPSLVELQIHTIRETCGHVPILVSNDDPSTVAAVDEICGRFPDVSHWPNHERIGHTGGDVSAYFKAAIWGASRGLKVVAKLSQRFVVTRPQWLHTGAADLLASGLSFASQRCRGTQRFDLRTEAALIDVARWNRPEILARIRPRRYWTDSPDGLSAETVIYRVLQDLAGEYFLPWNLIGEDRNTRSPGVVWHGSHSETEYRQLAAAHGVTIEPDFHCAGWEQDQRAGRYLHG